jgi:hypothetical protein
MKRDKIPFLLRDIFILCRVSFATIFRWWIVEYLHYFGFSHIFARIVAKAECPVNFKILHLKMEAIETVKQDFTPFHV